MHRVIARACIVLSAAIVVAAVSGGPIRADLVLFDFGAGFKVAAVEARDAKASVTEGPAAALRIATGRKQPWPGITLEAPQGHWDLSAFDHLAMEVKNVGKTAVDVRCRVDSGSGSALHSLDDGVRLEPGETKTLHVTLARRLPERLAGKIFGMRGNPGGVEAGKGIDAGNVTQLIVFVPKPAAEHVFEVRPIGAGGTAENYKWLDLDEKKLFPLIDRYGQFIHKDWPGKIHSDAELARNCAKEKLALAEEGAAGQAGLGPREDWDQYGGWQAGPQLRETGFFRVQKHEGKWWLVDPEGRLFWSHGSDCIRAAVDATPITDREFYYAELPGRDSPFGRFYGRGRRAPHGYYQDKAYETFSHSGANLMRKYGDDFVRQFNEMAHARLRSWGMNTIGNWSSREVSLLRKTPYVATVSSGRKLLEGSSGYWGKFPDVFDPDFQSGTRRAMAAEKGTTAGDPWCLGYFVDNEIAWGEELSLAEATLKSPPAQEAKKVLLADLKSKYGTIEKLNAAWGTKHASWDALLESRDAPDRKRAYDDLAAFSTKTAEQYFRVCRDAVREVAPHQLYLGCRFAWVNDRAIRAAANYCDVLSFNIYSRSVASKRMPAGVDKPIVVGEFHFGALDRGMFHTGLVKTASQQERAAAYKSYVLGALAHPNFVGTHWFQFTDQSTTGRGDGENYQIGLVDICDTPYPETIQAVREVGYGMYKYRLRSPL